MKFSIVATLYKSAPYIQEFYRRATISAQTLVNDDYEIILVNDGSPDNSLDLAIQLSQSDSHLVVIDLSRNFGHHKAMMTGLAHAQGDNIFLIDSDLEEEPELLELFYHQLSENKDCDVVYGVQKIRKGDFFEKLSGNVFYKIFRYLSDDIHLSENILTVRLMTRRYVKSLLQHGESQLFMAGILEITGYKQISVEITKYSKQETTYTLRKKLNLFVTAITSFSNKPLWLIFYTGILVTLVSLFFVVNITIRKLIFGIDIEGWTSIIVSVWFIGGLIICFMGIIGLYISIIFIETKKRPYVIIRQIYHKQITTEKDD